MTIQNWFQEAFPQQVGGLKMNLIKRLLCLSAILPCLSCNNVDSLSSVDIADQFQTVANETLPDQASPLPADQYEFELISVEGDSHQGIVGLFRFRHFESQPIELHGFGFIDDSGNWVDDSNVFIPRFEQFKIKKFESDLWEDHLQPYCGTGARHYALQPNRNYTIKVPVAGLVKYKSDSGMSHLAKVKLYKGGEVLITSQPFELTKIRKLVQQKQEAIKQLTSQPTTQSKLMNFWQSLKSQ